MDWGSLPKDIFFMISLYLDGRDGVSCQRVNKHWYACVAQSKCKKLRYNMNMHYVRVEKIEDLPRTLCQNKLMKLSQTFASSMLTNILWWKYQFNPYLMDKMLGNSNVLQRSMTHKLFKMEDFVYRLGYRGENQNYMRDTKTDNIMIVNDFYGGFDNPERFSKYEKMVANFREFQERFPGLFEWKLVKFPFDSSDFEFACARVHRGCCIQVIFKTQGVEYQGDIRSYLKRWELPPEYDNSFNKRKREDWINPPKLKEIETQEWLLKKTKR
jgi:hypothetical protein